MQSLLGNSLSGAWAEGLPKDEGGKQVSGGRRAFCYQRPTRLRKEFSLAWMSAGALKELRQLVSPLGLRRVTRPGKIIGALVRLAFLCEVGTLSWLTSETSTGDFRQELCSPWGCSSPRNCGVDALSPGTKSHQLKLPDPWKLASRPS